MTGGALRLAAVLNPVPFHRQSGNRLLWFGAFLPVKAPSSIRKPRSGQIHDPVFEIVQLRVRQV